jgi:hypothetical protein
MFVDVAVVAVGFLFLSSAALLLARGGGVKNKSRQPVAKIKGWLRARQNLPS